MQKQIMVMVMCLTIAVTAVACGRASQEDIDKALGLEPVASVGAGTPGVVTADLALGKQQFSFQCQQCHRPDGNGKAPALTGPESPAVGLTDEELATLIREGTGHGEVPAFSALRLNDKQLAGVIAYIRQQEAAP